MIRRYIAFAGLWGSIAGSVLLAATALMGSSVQSQGVVYADDTHRSSAVAVESGPHPQVSGGTAYVLLGFSEVSIVSYYPAPGYSVVGHGRAYASSEAYISHSPAIGASSKCYWFQLGVDGTAALTCSYFP